MPLIWRPRPTLTHTLAVYTFRSTDGRTSGGARASVCSRKGVNTLVTHRPCSVIFTSSGRARVHRQSRPQCKWSRDIDLTGKKYSISRVPGVPRSPLAVHFMQRDALLLCALARDTGFFVQCPGCQHTLPACIPFSERPHVHMNLPYLCASVPHLPRPSLGQQCAPTNL